MKRKIFLNRLGFAIGSTVLLPSSLMLQGCEYKPKLRTTLTKSDIAFLDEIGETIIPSTKNSEGAKASHIGNYMYTMYKDCMTQDIQEIFLNGLNEIDETASKNFSSSFMAADSNQKLQLIKTIHEDSVTYNLNTANAKIPLPHYFNLLKGMTIRGYYTSEIGMTKARRYLPVPGQFLPCIEYQKSDLPWAM